MSVIDIHTHHHPPRPLAVVSVSPENFSPVEGQLYSVGIHPWETIPNGLKEKMELLSSVAIHPQVVAIGETGIDKLKGGPLFLQMNLFKFHVALSERIGKPLVIHDVKAHDIILGLKKDLNPSQNWMIHGFRSKPTVAEMMLKENIYLSYGEKFNPESLKITPLPMILTETDESQMSIFEIIERLSQCIGFDIKERVIENTLRFLETKIKN